MSSDSSSESGGKTADISLSDVTGRTPSNFEPPAGLRKTLSLPRIDENIENQLQRIHTLLGDIQTSSKLEMIETKARIANLENEIKMLSEENQNLKNRNETLQLNIDHVVGEMERQKFDSEKLLEELKEKWETSKIQEEIANIHSAAKKADGKLKVDIQRLNLGIEMGLIGGFQSCKF
ncbi:Oidioi.mRNA.OKI2018_I69.chr1.g685.t1.cds [Oikopleura dioica]|uniref:Oidioi.mRNA.OKI2018_I69.chr1.g685.t1.cds n=1 Tax=Oikopleura dioica TaxID=34765 RepID=A0ABN7SKM3_OIKDI|nr:Oidioi.mRNA.OKI2018_I69.chr1.g685.t1.cds [Oikopleura dioica]